MSDQSNKNTPDYETEIKNREEKIKSLETGEIPTKSYTDNIYDKYYLEKERIKNIVLSFIKYYFEIFVKLVKDKVSALITKKKESEVVYEL